VVPSAVLDACVLYPIGLPDTLLNVAEAGLFRVLGTEEIQTETARNILWDTPGLTTEHRERIFAAMRHAFPEATTPCWPRRRRFVRPTPRHRPWSFEP
jgi:hypothetical protein